MLAGNRLMAEASFGKEDRLLKTRLLRICGRPLPRITIGRKVNFQQNFAYAKHFQGKGKIR